MSVKKEKKIKLVPKILIVNNFTRAFESLRKVVCDAVPQAEITVLKRTEIKNVKSYDYDLIILTGGHGRKFILEKIKLRRQRYWVKNSHTPIIGICLGAEIIASEYDSEIYQLQKVVKLFTRAYFCQQNFLSRYNHPKVFVSHLLSIRNLGAELEPLLCSKNGVQIFKHRHKKIYGLQFHPEINYLYQDGQKLFQEIILEISGI